MWPPALDDVVWHVEDWRYIAEGGANVIVGYVGPAIWPFVDVQGSGAALALRLPKTLPPDQASLAETYTPPPDVFIEQVLSHMLPRESLPVLRRIALTGATQHFVAELATRIEADRPIHRRESGRIHVTAPYMWAMRDYSQTTHADQIVVEIKPKCGFLPQLPETAYPCKRQYSRYKMHRVYKTLQKRGTAPSYAEWERWYDPLDLFSGDAERLNRAVHALCEDWARGEGNLHVMVQGRRASLQDVVAQVPWLRGDPVGGLAARVLATLQQPHNQRFLSRLVSLQQRLDPYDIEGLNRIWLRTRGKSLLDADDRSLPEISLTDYYDAAVSHRILASISMEGSFLRPIVASYLLSATLKDLSLILPIQSAPPHTASLQVIDLDAKCTPKLRTHGTTDHVVAKTFSHWLFTHS